jgi:uracil-DNA glycosylase
MVKIWEDMKWWNSGECQVIEERLDALDHSGLVYCPQRQSLCRALELTPIERCTVAIIGQDPYPETKYATGIAFSIPSGFRKYPPTLNIIYQELLNDLKVSRKSGSLEAWCKQGVLLWNAIPSCLAGKSLSHDWDEYRYLTQEVIQTLAEKGIVFAFLGGRARAYAPLVGEGNVVIETGHPSPRGNLSSRTPFSGSRLFSRINAGLVELGYEPISWES